MPDTDDRHYDMNGREMQLRFRLQLGWGVRSRGITNASRQIAAIDEKTGA